MTKDYKISLITAVLMNINIMIGTGILIGPGKMAAIAGNASFLGWPLVALLFLPIVMSTVQLNRMCPGSGGFYSYAKAGLGEIAGYISGWLYYSGYLFATSVEVLALRETLQVFMPGYFFVENAFIFNVLLLAICVGLNLLSLRIISSFLNSLTISKLLPLLTVLILIPFVVSSKFTITTHDLSLVPYSLSMAIFGYFGFEYCCSISHLIENSEKNAPRAILLGFIITGLIYTLFHFGVLNLMGASNLATLGAPAFASFINFNIPYLKTILALLIPLSALLTLFAGTNGMINSNATLMQSMAEEDLFHFSSYLKKLSGVGRPWVTVLLQAALVLLIVTFLPYLTVVGGMTICGVFMSFILPFISLFILKRQKSASFLDLLLTVVAIVLTVALTIYSWLRLADTMSDRLLYSLPLVGAIILGAFLYKRKK